MWTQLLLFFAGLDLRLVAAKSNCPLYGPLLPKPQNLLNDAGIKSAAKALDDIFVKYIDNDNSTGSDHFSYSVEVFSGSEDKALWSHYWTAPNLGGLNSSGVKSVDADTVYRIGSITKVFTVLTFLATIGDGIWNDPITKYIPEIAALVKSTADESIFSTDWEAITVGSLASQTSGLIRDYALLGEVTYQLSLDTLYGLGFPPVPTADIPPCGVNPTCNREQLFAGLGKLPPSFPPSATPAYSDLGFTLLSYVAEHITSKDFKTLVRDAVLKPLGLSHTFISVPNDALGIIPGNRYSTSWAFDLAEEAATGNMYSSAGDLSSLGRAVMRSTLLKPAMTRRWLKPAAFTSDPVAAVGMPWGIRQLGLSKDQPYQFVHTFNKAGSLGAYSSLLAIIPELDIGFTIMAAGDPPPGLAMDIADTLTRTYLPTMAYVARTQAKATFGGRYRHTGPATASNYTGPATASNYTGLATTSNSTSGFGNATGPYANSSAPLNSSLTITVDADRPGLGVLDWFSNGTDMAFVATAIGSNVTSEYFDKMKPSVRLYPTGLEQPASSNAGGKRVAFKAVFEDLSLPARNASFSTDCATWVTATAVVYAKRPLDLFIFDFDRDGKVTAVENAALRIRLDKVS
ncbi:beta-lactamase/transpeptidase-like protein [Lasiosphaeria miniovina]|uniref:Beta-lactamase/transpeptidase-like protein n=1 Tax=Lasiosphaeria miniovina TaxID=1954250 RepID=A0AA40B4T6_9PEZI|nr:beta-lactamase/transpeptidase-like protein [Lasiosphaeria miniovina]KAK0727547.1 beta-lactamase/transpeptidase-like protein [Lasiosphaeria miniovina]